MTSQLVAPAAAHRENHRELLPATALMARPVPAGDGGEPLLDGVIVPAYRPPVNLDHAVDVAAASGATLVLVCSGHVTAEGAISRVHERDPAVPTLAVDLRSWPGLGIPIGTALHVEATFMRRHDASHKRNLGLLLARAAGWSHVLLLNDDVRGLDREKICRARALLEPLESAAATQGVLAAGWAFSDFPDNSVVCHARRLLGGGQGTFVSDAALVIAAGPNLGFFPPVYNEDWLFLHDAVAAGTVAIAGDDLKQLAYNPFAQPRRAQAEEFGDVLGEGLFALLHEAQRSGNRSWASATMTGTRWWRAVLAHRRSLILDALARLDTSGHRLSVRRSDVRACLIAALALHADHWPAALAGWVEMWRRDLESWERLLAGVEVVGSPLDALHALGLSAVVQKDGLVSHVTTSAPAAMR
jgi:hypothetical protein